jgi:hypothetical protein
MQTEQIKANASADTPKKIGFNTQTKAESKGIFQKVKDFFEGLFA